jgi:uncharacterized membrane protein YbhN (UPF0104 family)
MAVVEAGASLKQLPGGSPPRWLGGGDTGRWRRLRNWSRVGLSLVLLGCLAWRVDWRGVIAIVRDARPTSLALGLILFLGAQLLSAAKWQWIARSLGCAGALSRHVRLYFAGMFLSLFLPGFVGGDLFRAIGLAGGNGGWMPTKATLWSVFLERLTGLWGLLLLLGVGLCLHGPLAWLRVAGAVGGLAVCAAPWVYLRLTRRDRAWNIPARDVAVVRDRRRVAAVLAISFLVQGLYAWVHLILAMALGIGLGWSPWLWVAPAVGLVASLPISLGGLGPREWGYLVTLQWAGLDREQAVAFAATWLLTVTVASLIGGGGLLGARSGPALRAGSPAAGRPHE